MTSVSGHSDGLTNGKVRDYSNSGSCVLTVRYNIFVSGILFFPFEFEKDIIPSP